MHKKTFETIFWKYLSKKKRKEDDASKYFKAF